MNILLRLKDWQLFLFLLVTALGVYLIPEETGLRTMAVSLTFFAWILSIVLRGQQLLRAKSFKTFNPIFFAINMSCCIVLPLMIARVYTGKETCCVFGLDDYEYRRLCLVYLTFAGLQIRWFAAKIISAVENDGKYVFSSIFINFLMLEFWIFGIWGLQPTMNAWAKEEHIEAVTM